MKILYLIFLFFLFFSCTKNQDLISQNVKTTVKKDTVTLLKYKARVNKVNLIKEATKVVDNWQEYQTIKDFMPKYYNCNTREALFNSQRLLELTKQLKDSIRVQKFNNASFKIRLNVLNNEAMRLADMDSIPSITPKEIITETNNVVTAFEAIKAKINAIVKKELVENDLKEFDHIFEIKKPEDVKTTSLLKANINRKSAKFRKRILPLSKK